jgi:hypothetical protein
MNIRRLSYGLLLTLASALVVGCGEPATPEVPTQPTASPTDVPAVPTATATATADVAPPAPTATATATVETPPPPVLASKKVVGKWVQDFSGEAKDAWEAANKAKFAKDKDTKKHDDAAKKQADTLAAHTLDVAADSWSELQKGKVTHKIAYTVGKDEAGAITIKLGKDETAKKDLKGAELTVTFSDDNTISVKDAFAKDPKKAQTLVFKRQ